MLKGGDGMRSGKQEPAPEAPLSPGHLFDFGFRYVTFLHSLQQLSEVGVICPFYPCGNGGSEKLRGKPLKQKDMMV